jgi:hypothetical protein
VIAGEDFLGISKHDVLGRTLEGLGPFVAQRFGDRVVLEREVGDSQCLERVVRFENQAGYATRIRTITLPVRNAAGNVVATKTFAVKTETPSNRMIHGGTSPGPGPALLNADGASCQRNRQAESPASGNEEDA